jgi:hypothetical protein
MKLSPTVSNNFSFAGNAIVEVRGALITLWKIDKGGVPFTLKPLFRTKWRHFSLTMAQVNAKSWKKTDSSGRKIKKFHLYSILQLHAGTVQCWCDLPNTILFADITMTRGTKHSTYQMPWWRLNQGSYPVTCSERNCLHKTLHATNFMQLVSSAYKVPKKDKNCKLHIYIHQNFTFSNGASDVRLCRVNAVPMGRDSSLSGWVMMVSTQWIHHVEFPKQPSQLMFYPVRCIKMHASQRFSTFSRPGTIFTPCYQLMVMASKL